MKSTVFWDVTSNGMRNIKLLLESEDGGSTFLRNVVNLYQTTRCHVSENRNIQDSRLRAGVNVENLTENLWNMK
jgi:hypothetical protein